MKLGILSDTHDELSRTEQAVHLLCNAGAEALVHCGDLFSPPILEVCCVIPCWFVFGNHDADDVPVLKEAAIGYGATCLEWGGVAVFDEKRVGVAHGHLTMDLRRVLAEKPDYLLTGHSHIFGETNYMSVRRINPGALHRATQFTVALLDLESEEVEWLKVPK